jgi:hypothetical protein
MDARLAPPPAAHIGFVDEAPVALAQASLGSLPGLSAGAGGANSAPLPANAVRTLAPAPGPTPTAVPKPAATETLAKRTGNLVNEVDFPGFVAQLVHGTFDAIVDASIRQMESYADLLSAVAKTTEQFTQDNVSLDQARDWVAQRYPQDVLLRLPRGTDEAATNGAQLLARVDDARPAWLSEFGLEDQALSSELLETQVLPQVRQRIGAERHQLLATMVTLGLNRVAVKDGSISAKVMFRATANDVASVQYAQSPGSESGAAGSNWGTRGNNAYAGVSTVVQTMNVNAQNDTNLRADLFGEVKLNFVSETLPLDKLTDSVKLGLVQRHAVLGRSAPALPAPAVAAVDGVAKGGA